MPESKEALDFQLLDARGSMMATFDKLIEQADGIEQELAYAQANLEDAQRKWQDAERRLAEANALLDQVHQYVDANDLAKLGESRVEALIRDNQQKSRFMRAMKGNT